jgi:putative transposase
MSRIAAGASRVASDLLCLHAVANTPAGSMEPFRSCSFWARGYLVSTVGRDEKVIREYIRNQEAEDKRLDQMNLWR